MNGCAKAVLFTVISAIALTGCGGENPAVQSLRTASSVVRMFGDDDNAQALSRALLVLSELIEDPKVSPQKFCGAAGVLDDAIGRVAKAGVAIDPVLAQVNLDARTICQVLLATESAK